MQYNTVHVDTCGRLERTFYKILKSGVFSKRRRNVWLEDKFFVIKVPTDVKKKKTVPEAWDINLKY